MHPIIPIHICPQVCLLCVTVSQTKHVIIIHCTFYFVCISPILFLVLQKFAHSNIVELALTVEVFIHVSGKLYLRYVRLKSFSIASHLPMQHCSELTLCAEKASQVPMRLAQRIPDHYAAVAYLMVHSVSITAHGLMVVVYSTWGAQVRKEP